MYSPSTTIAEGRRSPAERMSSNLCIRAGNLHKKAIKLCKTISQNGMFHNTTYSIIGFEEVCGNDTTWKGKVPKHG